MSDGAVVAIGGRDARGSFDDFYRESFAGVLRVATAVTGDPHVAAEVTQEAFLAARQRWKAVSDYDQPAFWVRRVAINHALSWRRRVAREAQALGRLRGRREQTGASDVVIDEVWTYVRRLPKRQAAVVALVYVDDLTIDQAARALGIGVPTAKTHLQRARRTLAQLLKEEIE